MRTLKPIPSNWPLLVTVGCTLLSVAPADLAWAQGSPLTDFLGWPIEVSRRARQGVAFLDVDSDGDLEVLFAIEQELFAYNHNGSAVPGWPVLVSNLYASGTLAIGDVTGDGEDDIVVATDNSTTWGEINVVTKAGIVAPGFPVSFPTYMRTPCLADLDADGVFEIVLALRHPAPRVDVLRGDGSTFPGWPQYVPGGTGSSPSAGDIDGDGLPEIVVEAGSDLHVWRSDGTPMDGFPYSVPPPWSVLSSEPTLVDLDDDGLRELVFGSSGNDIPDFFGRMDVINHDGVPRPGWPVTFDREVRSAPAIGDLDGDGLLDIVYGDLGQGSGKLYARNRDAELLPGFPVPDLDRIYGQPLVADIDGDDRVEVMFDQNTSQFGIGRYLGYNHDGTPMSGWPQTVTGGTIGSVPNLADVNGDGLADIAGGTDEYVYLWNTRATMNPARNYTVTFKHNLRRNGFYEAPVYGSIGGAATSASSGMPVSGAVVTRNGAGTLGRSAEDGQYDGPASVGVSSLACNHPAFLLGVASGVTVTEDVLTAVDFVLVPDPADDTPPVVVSASELCASSEDALPYPVAAVVTDDRLHTEADIVFRVAGGDWTTAPMTPTSPDNFRGEIPGQPLGSIIDYYIVGKDAIGNTTTSPPGGGSAYYTFRITTPLASFVDDMEADLGWVVGDFSDTATDGIWERADPEGTTDGSTIVQPDDDHTPTGTQCYVTGAAAEGSPSANDVDSGCTTLYSPIFDLADAGTIRVSYWRSWHGVDEDDALTVEITNTPVAWTPLETVIQTTDGWTHATIDLCDEFDDTEALILRFVACDGGVDTDVEAAIDDVLVAAFSEPVAVEPSTETVVEVVLEAVAPNPIVDRASVAYTLPRASNVTVDIFDVSGRAVSSLFAGWQSAGRYSLPWDGRDARGREVAAGTYFVRLGHDGGIHLQRITVVR